MVEGCVQSDLLRWSVLDAGWLCCCQQPLSYYVTAFFSFSFYLIHVGRFAVDAAQIVIKPLWHTHTLTPRGSALCRGTTRTWWHRLIVTLNEWQQVPAVPRHPGPVLRAIICCITMCLSNVSQTHTPASYFSSVTFRTAQHIYADAVSLYPEPNDQLSPKISRASIIFREVEQKKRHEKLSRQMQRPSVCVFLRNLQSKEKLQGRQILCNQGWS